LSGRLAPRRASFCRGSSIVSVSGDTGNGFELQVAFNEESPSIWRSAAKRHVLSTLPAGQRRSLQRAIEAFFASDAGDCDYHDPGFPFRLGNGGTLPVIRREGTDYYCLFYRDNYSTGWNIANGGANTRHDLKHPDLPSSTKIRLSDCLCAIHRFGIGTTGV